MNVNTGVSATTGNVVEYNGKAYAIWTEPNGSAKGQIRVKAYNGNTWTAGDLGVSLNYDDTKDAISPYLALHNNELYAIWQENNSYWQVRVKKFDGTSWTFVDGGQDNGINHTKSNGRNPKLAVYNNDLYAVWDEASGNGINQIMVKKYSNGQWAYAHQDVSSSNSNLRTGINKLTTTAGHSPSIIAHQSKLYVAWHEGSPLQIRVAEYDGSTWTFVDGGSDTTGLNHDTTKSATSVSLQVYNDVLYAAWSESATKNQIRVKKYENGAWAYADGGQATGINFNTGEEAYFPVLYAYKDELYAIRHEGSYSSRQIRVSKYNGSTWTSADGGQTVGLNRTSTNSANNGSLFAYNNELHAMWYEGSPSQIRVAVSKSKPQILKGDANGDGVVTPADALLVNKYIQGKLQLTDEQKLRLDMNDDMVIDSIDASMIMSIYLGKGV
ncbi:dockerin type I repeat-containing protein [Paenibacillus sp. YYML68]|uniref:dockerin type I repeat-containing protein n=1 Tax=Paenibacillus sp. YYML68 TaxID=2909250 RepID=UPI0024902F5A|nr:dockerin type I repeat-containing protein [Paenibacillus sp. YYML68]